MASEQTVSYEYKFIRLEWKPDESEPCNSGDLADYIYYGWEPCGSIMPDNRTMVVTIRRDRNYGSY